MKIVQACLLSLLILSSAAAESEIELRSRLEDDDFYNRIRFETDDYRLSLTALYADGNFEWLEPSFRSVPVIAGRLEPKGIIRECLNPDSAGPGSLVFSEKGRIGVTDSFARSSRFGAAMMPFDSNSAIIWCWMTNGGLIQSGLLLQELKPLTFLFPRWFQIETDFIFAACEAEENEPSSWFSEQAILPSQLLLLPAVELRFRLGMTENEGRTLLNPNTDDFSLAGSFLASYSVPVYTGCGQYYRGCVNAGNRNIVLSGLFQETDDAFIAMSGKSPSYSRIAGLSLSILLELTDAEIAAKTGYTKRQRHEEVIPSRCYAQSEIFEAEAAFSITDIFKLSVGGEFRREFETNGNAEYSSSVGVDAGLSDSGCSIGCSADWELGSCCGLPYLSEPVIRFETAIDLNPVELNLSTVFSGDEIRLKCGAEIEADIGGGSFKLKTSVETDACGISGVMIEVTSR